MKKKKEKLKKQEKAREQTDLAYKILSLNVDKGEFFNKLIDVLETEEGEKENSIIFEASQYRKMKKDWEEFKEYMRTKYKSAFTGK